MDGATYWQRRAQQQLIAAEQIAGQLEQLYDQWAELAE